MIIMRCDRCGKEEIVRDFLRDIKTREIYPHYFITAADNTGTKTIYLCQECESLFTNFLEGAGEIV